MNKAFREATTKTGFLLALSANQIRVLMAMRFGGDGWLWEVSAMPWGLKTLCALHDRGMVHASSPDGWTLTEAGRLTADLLKVAGLKK